MADVPSSRGSIKKDILAGVFLAAACYMVQHSSLIVRFFAEYPIKFEQKTTDGTLWTADTSGLGPGKYYASIGNTRAPCELLADGRKLDSNGSEILDLRNHLFLGAGFTVTQSQIVKQLSIVCQKQEGFLGLTHFPVVTGYFWGHIIQLWRMVTELLLGPLASLIIIISFPLGQKKIKHTTLSESPFENWPYLFFGIVSLAYALSLGLVTRLFLTGWAATVLHILIRNLFALSVLVLFASSKKSKWLIWVQVGLILIMGAAYFLAPNNLVSLYYLEYFFFPFSCAVVTFNLFREETSQPAMRVLRSILVAWTIIQIFDGLLLWSINGAYTAPTLILLLSGSALYLRNLERKQALKVSSEDNQKLRDIIQSQKLDEEIGRIARQVAHDIGSPIAALTIATEHLDTLPEETRVLIKAAIARIRAIAGDLIHRRNSSSGFTGELPSPQPLGTLILDVIAEKRLQHKNDKLEIESEIDDKAANILVFVKQEDFKRMVSNLLNNAIEAMSLKGVIKVRLLSTAQTVVISFVDTGRGIPEEFIKKVGIRGFSSGKSDGAGLGLSHAIKCTEEWGGRLEITSKIKVGTTVKIFLPQIKC